jgi:hypothetical protein
MKSPTSSSPAQAGYPLTSVEPPPPPVPADCDLRGMPIPLSLFVEMAVAQFGMAAADAEQMIREIAAAGGVRIEDVGHA